MAGGTGPADKIQITSSSLLLVEGKVDWGFFTVLLRHIAITDTQVEVVGGTAGFQERVSAAVLAPGFADVTRLALMRDADEDAQAAFRSAQSALRNSEQPIPTQMNTWTSSSTPKVGVYILPGFGRPGALETLCLEVAARALPMPCVEEFMACLRRRLPDDDFPKNVAKARMRAFLAAMKEDTNSIGVAAEKSYLDLDHSALDDVKAFLSEFA